MISLGLDDWRPVPEGRSLNLADFKLITDPPVTAGVTVNQGAAMSVSAYWNGVLMIAQSIGVLDRFLYRRLDEDDRERATTHPAYKLVHDQPNPYMTAQVFWETISAHAVSWGGGYAEIEFDNATRPIALWPITPDKITPKVRTYRDESGRRISEVYYEYSGQESIEDEDIIHIPGLGYDGLCGYSPVQLARRSLSLTIAAEEFGAAYFGNGSWTGAVLEHPGKLSPDAFERIKVQREQNRGPMKAHRLEILEEGMKLSRPLTIPPDDAQFLETREFQVTEIARWLNLPTWKLKVQQDARPGGNPEISQIDYLTDTLLPWTTRIEQELNRKLIPKAQRGTYFFEHLFAKILRADVTTRMSTYKSLFDMGVVDAQWIAKTENLPPPKPPEPAPTPSPTVPALPAVAESDTDARMAASLRRVTAEAMERYVRRESARVRQAVNRGAPGFAGWLEGFYQREAEVLEDFLEPAVGLRLAMLRSTADLTAVTRGLVRVYQERSRDELLALPAKDLEASAEVLLESWESERPREMVEMIAALMAEEEGPCGLTSNVEQSGRSFAP